MSLLAIHSRTSPRLTTSVLAVHSAFSGVVHNWFIISRKDLLIVDSLFERAAQIQIVSMTAVRQKELHVGYVPKNGAISVGEDIFFRNE
jgi:hypothetical protein